jgi:hypothetical protein
MTYNFVYWNFFECSTKVNGNNNLNTESTLHIATVTLDE